MFPGAVDVESVEDFEGSTLEGGQRQESENSELEKTLPHRGTDPEKVQQHRGSMGVQALLETHFHRLKDLLDAWMVKNDEQMKALISHFPHPSSSSAIVRPRSPPTHALPMLELTSPLAAADSAPNAPKPSVLLSQKVDDLSDDVPVIVSEHSHHHHHSTHGVKVPWTVAKSHNKRVACKNKTMEFSVLEDEVKEEKKPHTWGQFGNALYTRLCESKEERIIRRLDQLGEELDAARGHKHTPVELDDYRDCRGGALPVHGKSRHSVGHHNHSVSHHHPEKCTKAKALCHDPAQVQHEHSRGSDMVAASSVKSLPIQTGVVPSGTGSLNQGSVCHTSTGKTHGANNHLGFEPQNLSEIDKYDRMASTDIVTFPSAMAYAENRESTGTEIVPISTSDIMQEEDSETVDDEYGRGRFRLAVASLISSQMFELAMGFAIVSNALFMGIEIDYTAQNPADETPAFYVVIGYVYTTIFTFELMLRLYSEQRFFFWGRTSQALMWNCLDSFIVFSSLAEVVLDIIKAAEDSGDDGGGVNTTNLRIVRIIRVSRLMRLFRIGRIVRFVNALRTLVLSILHTLRAVFWSMLLLTIIMYVFGILCIQAASDYRMQVEVAGEKPILSPGDERLLTDYWGSLAAAMLTLYMSISGGISWTEPLAPLRKVNPASLYVFLVYITFTYFAVLNVIVGIFCQSAIESTQSDQEAMIQTFMANQGLFISRFKLLFSTIDSDDSGFITKDEFMEHVHDPKLQAYFATLDLDAKDAISLFNMLEDENEDERGIDVEDFVNGCLRLKGPAKSYDCARLMAETKALTRAIQRNGRILELTYKMLSGGKNPPPLRQGVVKLAKNVLSGT